MIVINDFFCSIRDLTRYGAWKPGRNHPENSPGKAVMIHENSVDHPTDALPVDSAARRREIIMFLVLAFVIWPFVAIAVVGGYGFIVWMYQTIAGPPGPPPV
jgi:nitrate reductase NapE